MKILITSLPDIGRINAQRPHHLIKHLSRDNEITVLCVKAWWLKEVNDSYRDEKIKDINLLYISDKKINPVFQELSLIKNFRKMNIKYGFTGYDLHLNLNSLIAGYYIAQKLKSNGIPTVFDVADDLPERIKSAQQIPYLFRNLAGFIGKKMFKICLKKADRITTITTSLMRTYRFPLNKSVVVPNGADVSVFNDFCEKHPDCGDHEGSFVLGFVGVFSKWVDLEPAFKAIRNLISVDYKIKMLVVGDGIYLEKFESMAKQYSIVENVIFTGFVPVTELPGYICRMDACLVFYSTGADCQHSFPLKLLEYMACGKPVISVKLDGVEEAVQDRVLYASNNQEIEYHISQLYHNSKLKQEIGSKGREFVREQYDWLKICTDFENVLRQAANEHTQ